MLRTVINRPKFIVRVEKTEQLDSDDGDARADSFTCDDRYRDDDRDVVRCDDLVGCVPLKLLRNVVFRRRQSARIPGHRQIPDIWKLAVIR
jgi:hypothetical protein